jgi:hypothetical protein
MELPPLQTTVRPGRSPRLGPGWESNYVVECEGCGYHLGVATTDPAFAERARWEHDFRHFQALFYFMTFYR